MPKNRQTHQAKTIDDRRQYVKSKIDPEGSTTKDLIPIIDSTDDSPISDKAQIGTASPTKPFSVAGQFPKYRLFEGIVIAIFIGLLSWGAVQLYSLNREVGEIKISFNNIKDLQTFLKTQVDKIETRLTNYIDILPSKIARLESRVDNLVDNLKDRKITDESKTDTDTKK